MSIYAAAFGFGLAAAAVLAVAAVAFSMQFGITDIVNVAFGPIMVACAFVALGFNLLGISVWLAMIPAGIVGASISLALNKGVYAAFQRRTTAQFSLIVVSLAVALVVQNVLLAVVG